MSTTKALDGFRPTRQRGGGYNTRAANEYLVSSGYASNIFTGDLVVNAGGYVNVQTTTTQKALGVFGGIRYTADNQTKFSSFWPANTSATDAYAYIYDDPASTYLIQADASVTVGDINSQNFEVTLGAGNTLTGRSGFGVKASTRTTGTGMVRPIAYYNVPGNNYKSGPEMAFPLLEVRLVKTVDAYISADSSVN